MLGDQLHHDGLFAVARLRVGIQDCDLPNGEAGVLVEELRARTVRTAHLVVEVQHRLDLADQKRRDGEDRRIHDGQFARDSHDHSFVTSPATCRTYKTSCTT